MNLAIVSRFRRQEVVQAQLLWGILVKVYVLNPDIGSVPSGWWGAPNSDFETDFLLDRKCEQ